MTPTTPAPGAATDHAHGDLLRAAGLRVTRPRLAVLRVVHDRPHARTDEVIAAVRTTAPVSVQAVYDVLHALTERGVVRRIQPAGSLPRFELRAGDNHHHVVCRACGGVTDIDCALGTAPCLTPRDLGVHAPGFVLDEAEVTYWGTCASCAAVPGSPADQHPDQHPTRSEAEKPTRSTDHQGDPA